MLVRVYGGTEREVERELKVMIKSSCEKFGRKSFLAVFVTNGRFGNCKAP